MAAEIVSALITSVFGLLVAIVAIISPIVTAVLNHKFELKLRRLKAEEQKQATISVFLSELVYISRENPHDFCGFSKESLAVVRYLPEEYINLLLLFISDLETRHEYLIPDAQVTFGDLWYDKQKYPLETPNDSSIRYHQIVNAFVTILKK